MAEPAPRSDIEIRVSLLPDEEGGPRSGTSVNLSVTGMLVRADRSIPRGTRLGFELAGIRGTGEVIWTRETEAEGVLLGMKFLSLKRRDLRTLARILATATSVESISATPE